MMTVSAQLVFALSQTQNFSPIKLILHFQGFLSWICLSEFVFLAHFSTHAVLATQRINNRLAVFSKTPFIHCNRFLPFFAPLTRAEGESGSFGVSPLFPFKHISLKLSNRPTYSIDFTHRNFFSRILFDISGLCSTFFVRNRKKTFGGKTKFLENGYF